MWITREIEKYLPRFSKERASSSHYFHLSLAHSHNGGDVLYFPHAMQNPPDEET